MMSATGGWNQLGYLDAIMSAPSFEASLFLVAFGMLLAIFVVGPVFLVLHFLLPKSFSKRYWREPYFQFWELNFFDTFLFGLQKTNMLCSVIFWPKLGKKRGLTEAYRDAPNWFLWMTRVWYWLFFGLGVTGILLIFGLGTFALIRS